MEKTRWLWRCTPGLSTLAIAILFKVCATRFHTRGTHEATYDTSLEGGRVKFVDSLLMFYIIFLHLIILALPLRIFRGAMLATQQIQVAFKEFRQEIDRPEARDGSSLHTPLSNLIHVSIIPSYKESIETLEDTLRLLASHRLAKSTYDIFLAMEERDPDAVAVAQVLVSSFAASFLNIQYTVHPSDIAGESQGKSANVAWAFKTAEEKYASRASSEDVLITVTDSDTHLLETYYWLIQRRHQTLRQQSNLAAVTLYVAPIIFDRNAHLVPRLVRAADIGWSCAGLACYKHHEDYRGIVFPTSVYTLPLNLASSIGGWDTGPGAIGEDMHMMLKCYFATNGYLNIESVASPASMSNITSSATGLSSRIHDHKARYLQALRHMWGCLDAGYAIQQWLQMGSSSAHGNTVQKTDENNVKRGSRPHAVIYGVHDSKIRFVWLRNAVLFLRLFEAHIFPLHFLCILVISNNYSQHPSSANTDRYLKFTLKFAEYARAASFFLTASSLYTAYGRFYNVCVETRQWEMRRAGLHNFNSKSSQRKKWNVGSVLDVLSVPLTSMLFGTLPLLQAVLSHLWTDRLEYRVSGKPTSSATTSRHTAPQSREPAAKCQAQADSTGGHLQISRYKY